jgi:hypothetical protein
VTARSNARIIRDPVTLATLDHSALATRLDELPRSGIRQYVAHGGRAGGDSPEHGLAAAICRSWRREGGFYKARNSGGPHGKVSNRRSTRWGGMTLPVACFLKTFDKQSQPLIH